MHRFLAFLAAQGDLQLLSACTAQEAVERGGCGSASPADLGGDPMTGAPGSHVPAFSGGRSCPGLRPPFVRIPAAGAGGMVGAFAQAAVGSDRQKAQETTITVNAEDTR
jgi:hypothetical protein